jgi:hypothetical protein
MEQHGGEYAAAIQRIIDGAEPGDVLLVASGYEAHEGSPPHPDYLDRTFRIELRERAVYLEQQRSRQVWRRRGDRPLTSAS